MWDRLNRLLIKAENAGHRTANKMHYYSVNAILIGLGYGVYSMFRDYNEFFIDARVYFLMN
jgi:hypothetical protein